MAWNIISATDVTAKFTPSELAMLQAQQGKTTGAGSVLTVVLNQWIGTLQAVGWDVLTNSTVPDSLRPHVVAMSVWKWLRDFPKLDNFKTKERKEANDEAEKALTDIRLRRFGAVESPYGDSGVGVRWNSAPKIIGRMAPVPPPLAQLQLVPTPLYANPNATSDEVQPDSPGAPLVPEGFQVLPQNGQVLLVWNVTTNATLYNIYRSTTSGTETLLTTTTGTNFTDTGLANGQIYFYQIASVNAVGTSPRTQEQSATPQSTDT